MYEIHFLFLLIMLKSPISGAVEIAPMQSDDCIEQIIQGSEIIASQDLDVNRDGAIDQVVVYGNDVVYTLIAINRFQADCKIELAQEITSRTLTTGRQNIEEVMIELVELTGDQQPEIHVALQKTGGGGGPRDAFAVHAIYVFKDSQWEDVFHISQCLTFHAFEFREMPSKTIQDIYIDEDRHCEPPWSSSRTYNLYRWNGAVFESVESGVIETRSTNPWWLNIACLSCLAIPLLGICGFVIFMKKRK